MKRLLPLLALTASIAAAGCGSSSSPSSNSTPAEQPTAAGAGVNIDMKNIALAPKDVTVKVGQKVTWTNQDAVDHNVVANDGTFKSSDFGQKGTYSYTPTKAGKIEYQ